MLDERPGVDPKMVISALATAALFWGLLAIVWFA